MISQRYPPQIKQGGFTLIESLVSIVVISIGLLGVAAMQYAGLKDSNRSNERSVATILTYDLVDRMRGNSRAAFSGQYKVDASSPPGAPGKDCVGTAANDLCSSQEMAQADLYDWYQTLTASLADARANIDCNDADNTDTLACSPGSVHTIQVMWDERRTGATGTSCDNSKPKTELLCLSMDVQI